MENISINFKVEGVDGAVTSIDNLSNSTKQLDSSVSKNTKSVQTYSQQIKALQKELIALGGRTKENAAEFDALSDRIRDLDDAREDLTIGTAKLDDALGNLPGPIGNAANSFKTFDLAVKNGRSALIQITKQFPLLKNAFVASGVGLIIVLFGALAAGVIKAFNSFAPLQKAVGNLGIAFNLVGKLLDPVVELIGEGLTVAINGAARAIAFLTGNLKEYEEEVKAAEATKALEENLKVERALFDEAKERFVELEREKAEAALSFRERVEEINKEYANNQKLRDKLLFEAQETYLFRINQAEKKSQDEKKKSIKLTDEQIARIKEAEELTNKQIQRRIELLKVENLGNITLTKDLEELQKRFDILRSLNDEILDPFVRLQKDFKIFGSTVKSEGVERLKSFNDELFNLSVSFQNGDIDFKTFVANIDSILSKTKEGGLFDKQVLDGLNNYTRALKIASQISKDFTNELQLSKNELDALKQGMNDETKTLNERNKIASEYELKRKEFIQSYAKELMLKKELNLSEKQSLEYATNQIDAYDKLIYDINQFNLSINEQEIAIGELNNSISELGTNTNALGTFLTKNSDSITLFLQKSFGGFAALNRQIIMEMDRDNVGTAQERYTKRFKEKMIELIPELKNATDEMFNVMFNNLLKYNMDLEEQLGDIAYEVSANNEERLLRQLEKQKEADEERLRQAGATARQLEMLDVIYAKRREQIQNQTAVMVLDGYAQMLGGIASIFGEQTAAYKALAFFEASIAAISSSIKAFEWAMEYTGPAATVLAPALAASTFAAQMARAFQIQNAPEPQAPNVSSTNIGANPTYQGYYEMGGMVYGRRHAQGGVMAEMEGGEYIINRRSMMIPGVSEMASTLNNLNNIVSNPALLQSVPQVVKAYVVSKEMTNQQSADKRIRDLSRL